MLFFIGLGLGSPKDITIRGHEALLSCTSVFLEAYTSLMVELDVDDGTNGKRHLAETLGINEDIIVLADRDMIEQKCEEQILRKAISENVAFLVVGDPFGATTHHDLFLRARQMNIEVQVIHNASILTAVGATGLQLYRFGETVSLCFWTDSWKPTSAFDKILKNFNAGLHTLCLLDIKVKEQSVENMMRGKLVYEPPRFMTACQAASQLIESIEMAKEKFDSGDNSYNCMLSPDTICVGVARLGSVNQKILTSTLLEMSRADLGSPLHSLIVPASLHELETEALNLFK